MPLETAYGIGVLLFVIGSAALIWLTIEGLKTQNATLLRRAQQAEQELQDIVNILSESEREKIERAHKERNRSRPHPNPPGFTATLTRLRQDPDSQHDAYQFAVGWEVTRGNPGIASLTLTDTSEYRCGNIALTGETGHGKGTLAHAILLQLAHNTTSEQLRFVIIDPKRVDGALWESKAHLWRAPVLGRELQPIKDIMDALQKEREQRSKHQETYRVRGWEELPAEIRPPRIIVWITELSTVIKAIGSSDDWLETELSQCRAAGITYLIDLQNQSGKEMSWRTHVGTFIAGFQSSSYHIRPNIGLSPEEINELGGVLQTELKRGQFTVRNKRDVITVTAPTMSTQDIEEALRPLPNAENQISVAQVPSKLGSIRSVSVSDDLPISSELWTKIASVARDLELKGLNPSRAEVYRLVFAGGDPKAKPSGDNYKRIRRVCDAEGLLLPRMSAPTPAEMIDTA